ncbi:hypothetical protein Q6253_30070, partial [Klebsiella quasipneumoniae]|nr:hypothetical protein [Klebsiella quasipneumoniae]
CQVERHIGVGELVSSYDILTLVVKRTFLRQVNEIEVMPLLTANKPLLSHPDKIYPGQTLRIPE